jgi:hypothetical protein
LFAEEPKSPVVGTVQSLDGDADGELDGALDGTAEKIGACDEVGSYVFVGAIESEGMDDLDGADEGFGEGAGVKTRWFFGFS